MTHALCRFCLRPAAWLRTASDATRCLLAPSLQDRDAAREMHRKRGLPFLEVFMDVPLSVVKARDPKGLYKKVSSLAQSEGAH